MLFRGKVKVFTRCKPPSSSSQEASHCFPCHGASSTCRQRNLSWTWLQKWKQSFLFLLYLLLILLLFLKAFLLSVHTYTRIQRSQDNLLDPSPCPELKSLESDLLYVRKGQSVARARKPERRRRKRLFMPSPAVGEHPQKCLRSG